MLWLPALLAVLLAGVLGAAAWASHHRNYAYPVDYTRIAVANSSPYWSLGGATVIQEWSDPRRRSTRISIAGLASPIDRVLHDGHAYDYNDATRQLFAGSTMTDWLDWLMQRGCAGLPAGAGRTARLDIGSGYTAVVRCARSRFGPRTLPADIFAPVRRSQTLWDRLLGWLAAHVPGLSGQVRRSGQAAP